MMKIRIYQINADRDSNRVMFMSLDLLKQFQKTDKVDRTIYDEAFSGTVDCRTLADVFMVFNLYHPDGYRGRSLSVSDVVEIVEGGAEQPGFYFCDSFGFTLIDF